MMLFATFLYFLVFVEVSLWAHIWKELVLWVMDTSQNSRTVNMTSFRFVHKWKLKVPSPKWGGLFLWPIVFFCVCIAFVPRYGGCAWATSTLAMWLTSPILWMRTSLVLSNIYYWQNLCKQLKFWKRRGPTNAVDPFRNFSEILISRSTSRK